jgi:hypothetical protein
MATWTIAKATSGSITAFQRYAPGNKLPAVIYGTVTSAPGTGSVGTITIPTLGVNDIVQVEAQNSAAATVLITYGMYAAVPSANTLTFTFTSYGLVGTELFGVTIYQQKGPLKQGRTYLTSGGGTWTRSVPTS